MNWKLYVIGPLTCIFKGHIARTEDVETIFNAIGPIDTDCPRCLCPITVIKLDSKRYRIKQGYY